ncbi:MAG: hypothetical protein GF341_05790 [candidate division Zixibacteria bacterium]|nr:hypothetical protein [candidate division Zixibacteria bacterium]
MRESFRCPFCQQVTDIDLTQELERGETDLRGVPDERQNLRIDLPKRLLVSCTNCTRQFVVQPGVPGIDAANHNAGSKRP